MSKWCFIVWKQLNLVRHMIISIFFHCPYSILLRLMKSRQKKVWTFCKISLSIIMHSASKLNAVKLYLHYLIYIGVCFPLFWICFGDTRNSYRNCDLPADLLGWSLWIKSNWWSSMIEKEAKGKHYMLHTKFILGPEAW